MRILCPKNQDNRLWPRFVMDQKPQKMSRDQSKITGFRVFDAFT